jgi:FkbM family methyltransferase
MTFRRSAADALPPKVAMRLRAMKNKRNLFGLHAPASQLSALVPPARLAVDAGAATGLYAYFMGKVASSVHCFEPNPDIFRKLELGRGRNIMAYNVALSDFAGTATLHLPPTGAGEASLEAHPGRGSDIKVWQVETRTLDSYSFQDVGFLKIDVEGHEEAPLRGARQTIARSKPAIFIEIEERHLPGSVDRVLAWIRSEVRYSSYQFLYNGELRPFSEFDQAVHQDSLALTPSSPLYVSNFLVRP